MKEFKKKDIRLGMVVRFRNGEKGLIVKLDKSPTELSIIIYGMHMFDVRDFDSNLKNTSVGRNGEWLWDIVGVYETDIDNRTLLEEGRLRPMWERIQGDDGSVYVVSVTYRNLVEYFSEIYSIHRTLGGAEAVKDRLIRNPEASNQTNVTVLEYKVNV